jgi:hypothetical protein
MRRWYCWGRGEMVAVLNALIQEIEGLSDIAWNLEQTIAVNVAEILEARK